MKRYEFAEAAGQALDAPLEADGAKAARQLKDRLEELGLTYDHFLVEAEGSTVRVSGDAAMQEQKEKILLALGNTRGVTAVEDRVDAGQEEITPRFVTLREGETLIDVAARIYGDRAASVQLHRDNTPFWPDPGELCSGWVLRAPARSGPNS